MSDKVDGKDVNTSDIEDVVIDDLSDVTSSGGDLETHNPDIDEYDKILAELDAKEDVEEEAGGDLEKTDDSETKSDDDSAGKEDKDTDDARIPKARLDEVIAQREEEKSARLAAEQKISQFEQRLAAMERARPEPTPVEKSLPMDELLGKEPQEIVDAFSTNPAEFLTNLESRITQQNMAKLEAQREEEAFNNALQKGLNDFANAHEDFMESLPKLGGILDSSPVHNALSAYYEGVKVPSLQNQLKELEGQISTAREEGIKQGRKEAIEAVRAKGLASTLDGSQSVDDHQPGDEWQDSERHGGKRSLAVKQLLERRKSH